MCIAFDCSLFHSSISFTRSDLTRSDVVYREIGFNNTIMLSGLVNLYGDLCTYICAEQTTTAHSDLFFFFFSFFNKLENGMWIVMQCWLQKITKIIAYEQKSFCYWHWMRQKEIYMCMTTIIIIITVAATRCQRVTIVT